MTKNILGITVGHDAAACLLIDGRVVADAAEERFRRIKHFPGLPFEAVKFCLTKLPEGESLDLIAVPSKNVLAGLDFMLGKSPRDSAAFGGGRQPPIYIEPLDLGDVPVMAVEHHLAHAASAYFTGPSNDKTLVATIDGAGDDVSTCLWLAEGDRIEPLEQFPMTASLGWFYSMVTEALGWQHGDGEGKTMGLAAYGDPAAALGRLDDLRPQFENGKCVREELYVPRIWIDNGYWEWHVRQAVEVRALIEELGREVVAAEAQRVLEHDVLQLLLPTLAAQGTQRLCCAGGVFLNVKLNQAVWASGAVRSHHVFPNAGDSGLAVGAALYAHHQHHPFEGDGTVTDVYWGSGYDDDQVRELLDARGLSYENVDDPVEAAARALADGRIVGWFQGRMESGPRALGNRSILMSPLLSKAKDVINSRVKFRESFRPFCPSIAAEHLDTYVDGARDAPFMITSCCARAEKAPIIPAVVHVDGTMRVQSVRAEANPRYHRLIEAFGRLTGEHVLLNTSLNIKGEPIIEHPRQAVRCFYDTGLDDMFIGNLRLHKGR